MDQQQEPTFGGAAIPSPEVFEQARRNNPKWVQTFESAYKKFASQPENAGVYADLTASGATIQQTWMLFTLFGIEMYCLLAGDLAGKSTEKISRLENCKAHQLVKHLKAIQANDGSLGVTVAYHDGETGHCITITSYDENRDRFVYHDPWPERSLLAKENNAAGVDAQPDGSRWSVTAEELERVVFAAFVFPHHWARVTNIVFDINYDDWKSSEFFDFFHLEMLDEREQEGIVQRVFAPQSFTQEVRIFIDSQPNGKITVASLRMIRSWVIASFPLPFDLIKSFVSCFAPAPDQDRFEKIAAAFWALNNPKAMKEAMNAEPNESEAMRCIHAFMGSAEETQITSDFARLAIGMQQANEHEPVVYADYQLK